jgi:two-component system NarL family response regulator
MLESDVTERASIRVFIVDDHPVVRSGLRTMLESTSEFTLSGMAASGEEALATMEAARSDVMLLDLRMPGMTGVELMEQIRKRRIALPTVVLTNYHSDEDIFRAFQAGAMAYLLKSASGEELLDTIRKVHAGERWIPASIAQQLAERLGRTQLSVREQEVLVHVAKGLTNREIGEVLFISDKTVRNHVISCLEKLGAKDRTEATTIALRRGLIHLEERS